jgi:hypothetical protein
MPTKPAPTDLQTILKVNGYNPQEVKFLTMFDIVPKSLNWMFDNGLWDNCPFSFGDNNYTLIDALTIRNWIVDFIDSESEELSKKMQKDLDKLIELLNLCFDAQVYINVE